MPVSTEFATDITTALSGNLADVELTQSDWDFAFDKSKRTFQQRANNNLDKKFYPLAVTANNRSYVIPAEENIDTIIRFIKPRSTFSPNDPFSIASINQLFGNQFSGTSSGLLTYELGMQMLDNVNIYIANDTDFIWKKRNNSLTLLDTPKTDGTWLVECYADLSDAEYEEVLWIRNFTIAECKIILGRAYRKFQSLTTPTGETSLDGEQLVQEGKDEQERLIESIGDYTDGDPTGAIIMIG